MFTSFLFTPKDHLNFFQSRSYNLNYYASINFFINRFIKEEVTKVFILRNHYFILPRD